MENSELITKALGYIRAQKSNGALTIEEIAEQAGFSTDYFNRIFFAHTGFNVMEYLRFCRLKNAALQLRETDDDVLDIALRNGYETHESFSRAFKKQYGIPPTEYRKKLGDKDPCRAEFFNETVGSRMMHEFKRLKLADRDEVIDFLLDTDAVRYGYTAFMLHFTGGATLYIGDDFRDGFVWVTEWGEVMQCDIICCGFVKAAEYMRLFGDRFSHVNLYADDDDETLIGTLEKEGIEVTSLGRIRQHIYSGAPYDLKAPDGVSVRELGYSDVGLLDRFNASRKNKLPMIETLKRQLNRRDVLGAADSHAFCFGIFRDGTMIGISLGDPGYVRGFGINNCIYSFFLEDRASEELYVYAFKYVTNAALEKGLLPFDDVQIPDNPEEERCGKFNSSDFGYKLSLCVCVLKYTIK